MDKEWIDEIDEIEKRYRPCGASIDCCYLTDKKLVDRLKSFADMFYSGDFKLKFQSRVRDFFILEVYSQKRPGDAQTISSEILHSVYVNDASFRSQVNQLTGNIMQLFDAAMKEVTDETEVR